MTPTHGPEQHKPDCIVLGPKRGFTLLEMMVVLGICLTMVILMAPIFTVTTRTVRHIEVKLSVYEAARNILDIFEKEARQAVFNEKGELFGIKKINFDDLDAFTPPGNNKKYVLSRREADALFFLKRPAGGDRQYTSWLSRHIGGMGSPWAEPFDVAGEVYLAALWTSITYNNNMVSDQGDEWNQFPWILRTRPGVLASMNLNEAAFYFRDRWRPYGSYEEQANAVAPGHEPHAPASDIPLGDGEVRTHSAAGGQVLDLDIAYWDAGEARFKNLADHTAVYFAPPPRALRFTITVCDHEKRGQVTLSRVVRLPTGSGKGQVAADSIGSPDPKFFDDAIYPYNRAKNLKLLQPFGSPGGANGIYP